MEKIAVIADPHGCHDTFVALIKRLKEDHDCHRFCVSGDVIDRGPKSKELVQYLIDNADTIDCTLGNHEHLLLYHLGFNSCYDYQWVWVENGGDKTVESYTGRKALPDSAFSSKEVRQVIPENHISIVN